MFEFEVIDDVEQDQNDISFLRDEQIVILSENERVLVVKFHKLSDQVYVWDRCYNWRELESEACAAIVRGSSLLIADTVYSCPESLVQRAMWCRLVEKVAYSA